MELQERRNAADDGRIADLPCKPGNHSGCASALLAEDIWSQMLAGDFASRYVFDRGPPLGLQQNFAGEPVRNGLLFEGRTIEESGDAFSKSRLGTAAGFNGSTQGGNVVRFIHKHPLYKHTCDSVNKHTCLTGNKRACEVLYMPNARKKPVDAPAPVRKKKPFPVGPDGKTANKRLEEALERHPVFKGDESALRRECNRIAQGAAGEKEFLSQQQLNNFLLSKDNLQKSSFLTIIADGLGVRAFWLQTGIGLPTDERAALLDHLMEEMQRRQLRPSA
jgi:hypothetical protein